MSGTVNEGSETTLGEVYWDAYASSDPAYIEHIPFGTLGPDQRKAIEAGACAVAAAVKADLAARAWERRTRPVRPAGWPDNDLAGQDGDGGAEETAVILADPGTMAAIAEGQADL